MDPWVRGRRAGVWTPDLRGEVGAWTHGPEGGELTGVRIPDLREQAGAWTPGPQGGELAGLSTPVTEGGGLDLDPCV